MIASLIRGRVIEYVGHLPAEESRKLKDRVLAFQVGPFGWILDIFCVVLFGRNLKMLATIYWTDKWNTHWYAQHYEELFRRLRRKNIKIVEIGVGGYDDPRKGGNSLRMWRAYFPKGRIYGVDIFDKSFHNERRIKIFQGSQADPDFLSAVLREVGTPDIIIDDGSHMCNHVIFTFRQLFSSLADGGFYVVEDTETSYQESEGGNSVERNDLRTTMGYFKSLTDGLNWEELRDDYHPTYLDMNIKAVTFYHNLIVIKKGSNQEGSCLST